MRWQPPRTLTLNLAVIKTSQASKILPGDKIVIVDDNPTIKSGTALAIQEQKADSAQNKWRRYKDYSNTTASECERYAEIFALVCQK